MNTRTMIAAAVLLLVASGTASAKNSTEQLSPQNAKDRGFSVTAEPDKDGTVQVTISRDLSKLRAIPADADIEVCRTATLSVDGESGLVLQCRLEGEAQEGTIVYRFTIAQKLASQSRLSIAEMVCPKDRGPSEAQGHTFFFQMADFIGK
jgi:hypothetical protein